MSEIKEQVVTTNKEWTGNKHSVVVMNGDVHNADRAKGDYYTTDPMAVLALAPELRSMDCSPIIWEPACGCGNISKALETCGYKVVSTDLYDRGGYGESGRDFLKETRCPDGCSTIITNPPYNIATEFINHALDILPYGGKFIALFNINYLAGKQRYKELYTFGYLHKVYVFSSRIHCYKNNEPTGESSPVNYGWFIFSNKICKETTIDWLTT